MRSLPITFLLQMIKVMEIRDNTTIQVLPSRIFASMGPPNHKITAMYYQKRNKSLLLGAMQVTRMLKCRFVSKF